MTVCSLQAHDMSLLLLLIATTVLRNVAGQAECNVSVSADFCPWEKCTIDAKIEPACNSILYDAGQATTDHDVQYTFQLITSGILVGQPTSYMAEEYVVCTVQRTESTPCMTCRIYQRNPLTQIFGRARWQWGRTIFLRISPQPREDVETCLRGQRMVISGHQEKITFQIGPMGTIPVTSATNATTVTSQIIMPGSSPATQSTTPAMQASLTAVSTQEFTTNASAHDAHSTFGETRTEDTADDKSSTGIARSQGTADSTTVPTSSDTPRSTDSNRRGDEAFIIAGSLGAAAVLILMVVKVFMVVHQKRANMRLKRITKGQLPIIDPSVWEKLVHRVPHLPIQESRRSTGAYPSGRTCTSCTTQETRRYAALVDKQEPARMDLRVQYEYVRAQPSATEYASSSACRDKNLRGCLVAPAAHTSEHYV